MTTPDPSVSSTASGSRLQPGRLRSEWGDDFGIGSRQRLGAKLRHLKARSLEDFGRSAVRMLSRRGSGRAQGDS